MRLGDLADIVDDVEVTGFALNHRQVARGNVFGAFRGTCFNGEDYIAEAVQRGAVAVVARPTARVEGAKLIAATEPRKAFAELAARFYAPYPDTIVAVTGTNGKTSIVEMVRQLWRMAGYRSASIGTLGVTTADEQVRTGLTSPDIVTFLANMAGMRRMGISHVAYEASSHGLDQYRAEGVLVKAAAFTNLSRDHLDYHVDMDRYFDAKMHLFDEVVVNDGAAVVWADDAKSGDVIARARARGLTLLTVGEAGETITLVSRRSTALGQQLMLRHAGREHQLTLPLIGAYQVANVLVAAGLVLATGGDWAQTLLSMGRVAPVRGRLERAVITRAGAPVYVDYAHTPDAVEAAIAALRSHVATAEGGRLITVIGAGGDRDEGKRAAMGAVAARLSEVVIVTDDNPRSEDPAVIRRALLAGAPGSLEIGDRRAAIAAALAAARAGDIVLIAGKGHEQGQIVGAGQNERVLPFDDVSVARECAS
ncbi:MAG: UDP-N-acetylmuramoyl-L-alanyl-D-glutamate--2,6-diaminopimelate ligase [Pseudomonadota bacterium]|nr:UDP-N-acetylmuramoyl-L-alanyl-D-glutamate--2,6-diaminopimelate ligase [Pseudomonadota bacterium]